MKKLGKLALILFAVQMFAIQVSFAQKLKPADVPSEVSQAMDFQYPYVKVSTWQLDGNEYVATFKDEGSVGKAYISRSGEWLRTTYDIKKDELPSVITEYVKTNYPDFIISSSYLEEKEDVPLHYMVEVKTEGIGFKPSRLSFSDKGDLLSREDPDNFKDPVATESKPVAENVPAKQNAAPKQNTTPKETAAPKQNTTTKPASDPKPAAKPEPKPKPEAKPKPEPAPKPEKPKKEKPEPVVTDELGNVAIDASEVPDVVKKNLVKKILHPEDLNWFEEKDQYVAKCVNSGRKTAAYFSKDGVWDKTLTVLPEEAVTGPMLKHLNDFYKGFKFKTAIKETRADKDDKTMVEFYEKANFKAKVPTTVIFDKTGKLLRTIEADPEMADASTKGGDKDNLDKYYAKMNMSLEEKANSSASIPENVQAVFKLKYPRVTNVEWKETDDMSYEAHYYSARGKEICVISSMGSIVETLLQGKPENLSSTIQSFIKKEYKGSKVVEYYSVKRIAEKLNLYKVIIQEKKATEPTELWFNLNGRPYNN